MSVKDKMVEIIKRAPKHIAVFSFQEVFPRCDEAIEDLVNHLIANGVTIFEEEVRSAAAICELQRLQERAEQMRLMCEAVETGGVYASRWIPVSERLPTEDEDSNQSLVGVVNGHNSSNVGFVGAHIFVRYSHEENVWWSDEYDIEGCKVIYWMPLPEPPKGE